MDDSEHVTQQEITELRTHIRAREETLTREAYCEGFNLGVAHGKAWIQKDRPDPFEPPPFLATAREEAAKFAAKVLGPSDTGSED